MEIFVTTTRTGFYLHASTDKKVTLCGSKVKAVYGVEGTLIETMTMESNEVFLVPAAVTCEKCLAAKQ